MRYCPPTAQFSLLFATVATTLVACDDGRARRPAARASDGSVSTADVGVSTADGGQGTDAGSFDASGPETDIVPQAGEWTMRFGEIRADECGRGTRFTRDLQVELAVNQDDTITISRGFGPEPDAFSFGCEITGRNSTCARHVYHQSELIVDWATLAGSFTSSTSFTGELSSWFSCDLTNPDPNAQNSCTRALWGKDPDGDGQCVTTAALTMVLAVTPEPPPPISSTVSGVLTTPRGAQATLRSGVAFRDTSEQLTKVVLTSFDNPTCNIDQLLRTGGGNFTIVVFAPNETGNFALADVFEGNAQRSDMTGRLDYQLSMSSVDETVGGRVSGSATFTTLPSQPGEVPANAGTATYDVTHCGEANPRLL